MECYIFKKGEIGDHFIEALSERARAGVRVTIVMDAIGSFGAFRAVGEAARGRPAAASRPISGSRGTASPAEQPHPPRAAGRRRHGRVRRRRRRRRLVGQADARQADVARHDGAHRRAGRVGHPGRRRRELARVLRRDPDRRRRPTSRTRRPATSRRSRSRARRRIARRRRARCSRRWSKARPRSVLISTPYFLPDKAFRDGDSAHGPPRRRDRR